jgi:hypothetical protein
LEIENIRLKNVILADKWFILAVSSLILISIWFGVIPVLIRQACQEKAREAGVQYFDVLQKEIESSIQRGRLQTEYMEGFYSRCLHDRGLKE